MQRITFESSHVYGDLSTGRLTIGIGRDDEQIGQTIWDEIEFSVPPDFHTHNDAVAAALMTLAGQDCQRVTFNFPISTYCAETLRRYYRVVRIGPVDPALEPRRAGRRIGLNFSGGLDSTAAWVVLQHALGDDFAVITSEYGGFFTYEAQGYSHYHRDVSCWTNLRRKHYDRVGRFNFCVPLLFAEYLDLGSITTGHSSLLNAHDLEWRAGVPPAFLQSDLVVHAGGLQEVHLLRGLYTQAVLRILVVLAPERIEAALAASHPLGTAKRYTRARMLRDIFLDIGAPLPAFLETLPRRPTDVTAFGIDPSLDTRTLAFVKREGLEQAAQIWPWVAQRDLSFLDDLAFTFPERYNTTVVDLIPLPLRSRVVELFEQCGIAPYDERDWRDLATVCAFLRSNGARYLMRR